MPDNNTAPNPPEDPILSPADFAIFDWEATASNDPRERVFDYTNPFFEAAEAARESGDERRAAALRFLGHACSLHMRLDEPEQPFAPFAELETARSATLDDLRDTARAVCPTLAVSATDPALRARLGDLAWVVARAYRGAEAAVESYIQLAERLRDRREGFSRALKHLERAWQIGLSLGRSGERAAPARSLALDVIERRAETEDTFISAQLMDMLLKYERSPAEAEALRRRAEAIAERAEAAGDWHRARGYWERSARLAERAKDTAARRAALRRVAEAHVAEAAATAERPHVGQLTAALYVQQAIEVLRRLGGERERVDELHALLLQYQRGGRDQLVPISSELDLTEQANAARDAVAGAASLPAALLRLGAHVSVPHVRHLREQAEENASKYMLSAFFPKLFLSDEGKVIARPGSTASADPEVREAALRADMIQAAALHAEVAAAGSIVPARRVIMTEHPVRTDDILELTQRNPMVPEGRELLWAEGLYAGFIGDLPRAIHILIPQIEHSVRMLLARAGILVSGLDGNGIQMEHNLNRLLYEPVLAEMLGDDLVFMLQALLIEQAGPNLRNGMAHGLLSYESFYGGTALYTWWLALRLCCEPIFRSIRRAPDTPDPGEHSAEGAEVERVDETPDIAAAAPAAAGADQDEGEGEGNRPNA